VTRDVPSTTTTDLVHAPFAAPRAVRAPHHDDSATVRSRIGEWQAVRGDQRKIDEGRVVIFNGEPCDHLHLAAHRSTHGSPFARLVELHAGDQLEVWTPSVSCIYEITEVRSVTSNLTPPYGHLMMQTSLPGGFFLAFGKRV